VLSLTEGTVLHAFGRVPREDLWALGFTSRGELVVRHDAETAELRVYSPTGDLLGAMPTTSARLEGDFHFEGRAEGGKVHVKLTDLVAGTVREFVTPIQVFDLAVSPSGDRVAVIEATPPYRIQVWDTRAGAR
jgi:hypothetical protein